MKALSLLLVSLLFLQACAGSVSRGPERSSPAGEPGVMKASVPVEDSVPEKPKRRWWPWIVGGVAVAAIVTGTLIVIALHNFEPGVGDFDFGWGSGSKDGDKDDGGTIPIIASRR